MAEGRNDDILINSLEEFQNLIIEEFYRKLGRSEKQAAETGQTIVGEYRLGLDQGAEPVLRVRYICEPGKPAQLLTYALSSGDGQSFGRLH
jgi:hypothetical protein